MAAIAFDNSPSNGDTVVANGVTYTYDSTAGKWKTPLTRTPSCRSQVGR